MQPCSMSRVSHRARPSSKLLLCSRCCDLCLFLVVSSVHRLSRYIVLGYTLFFFSGHSFDRRVTPRQGSRPSVRCTKKCLQMLVCTRSQHGTTACVDAAAIVIPCVTRPNEVFTAVMNPFLWHLDFTWLACRDAQTHIVLNACKYL